jgi:hypothetical protein
LRHAPGLAPSAVLEKLAEIQTIHGRGLANLPRPGEKLDSGWCRFSEPFQEEIPPRCVGTCEFRVANIYSAMSSERQEVVATHAPSGRSQLRALPDLLSVASSSVCGFSLQASQASDVGSIPIARSISLDDSVAFMRLSR